MRYKNWALEIPDLHHRGFCHDGDKNICLYGGGDGGGGSGGDGSGGVSDAGSSSVGVTGAEGASADSGVGVGESASVGSDGVGPPGGVGPGSSGGSDTDTSGTAAGLAASGDVFGALAQAIAELGISPTEAAMMGQVSQSNPAISQGITLSELGALSSLGLGSMMGVNANNPTQSVDEAIVAANVNAALSSNLPAILGFVNPALGSAVAVTQGIAGLATGQTSIGQAVASMGVNAVANAIGVPAAALSAALNGNLGQAVANTAMAGAQAAVGSALGIPAGIAGLGLSQSGLGSAASQGIAGAVNAALGATPSNNMGSFSQAIDAALGIGQGVGAASNTMAAAPDAITDSGFGFMPNASSAPNIALTDTNLFAPFAVDNSTPNNVAGMGFLAALLSSPQQKEEQQMAPTRAVQSPFGMDLLV